MHKVKFQRNTHNYGDSTVSIIVSAFLSKPQQSRAGFKINLIPRAQQSYYNWKAF